MAGFIGWRCLHSALELSVETLQVYYALLWIVVKARMMGVVLMLVLWFFVLQLLGLKLQIAMKAGFPLKDLEALFLMLTFLILALAPALVLKLLVLRVQIAVKAGFVVAVKLGLARCRVGVCRRETRKGPSGR